MSEHSPSSVDPHEPQIPLQAMYNSCLGEVLTQFHMARAQHAKGRMYIEEETLGRLVTAVGAEAVARHDAALADRALEDFDTFTEVFMDTWTKAYFLGIAAGSEKANATLRQRLEEEKEFRAIELASRGSFREYAYDLSPLARDDDILTGIIKACQERGVLPTTWIRQGAANQEERWRFEAAYHADELAAEGQEAPFHQERFEGLAQELLHGDFSEGFVFSHIRWILQHSKDPAVRLQAVDRLGDVVAVAPCTTETCMELLRTARDSIMGPEPVSEAVISRLETTIAEWTSFLQPYLEGAEYYRFMNAKLAWDRARQLRQDGDIEAAIVASHTQTHRLATGFQARYPMAEESGSRLLQELNYTRHQEMTDWALRYVTQRDFATARRLITAIDDGAARADALRQCLECAQALEDVTALHPDPMDMALYPSLSAVVATAEARFTKDTTRLQAIGLQMAHDIVMLTRLENTENVGMAIHHGYGDLRQVYADAVQVDPALALPFAESLFSVTQQAPDAFGESDFLLAPLWRAGNTQALHYAYAQLEYTPDADLRIHALVRLMGQLSSALGRA